MKPCALALAAIITAIQAIPATPIYSIFGLYDDSNCTSIPNAVYSNPSNDSDCITQCSNKGKDVPIFEASTCASNVFDAVNALYGQSTYFLEMIYVNGLFFQAVGYHADGGCYWLGKENVQVLIENDGSATVSFYDGDCATSNVTFTQSVSADDMRTHRLVTSGGRIDFGYNSSFYTNLALSSLATSASGSSSADVGEVTPTSAPTPTPMIATTTAPTPTPAPMPTTTTTSTPSSTAPPHTAPTSATAPAGWQFLMTSYYADIRCRGFPTYSTIYLTQFTNCSTPIHCGAVDNPDNYNEHMRKATMCDSSLFHAAASVYGQAPFFLEALLQNRSIVGGYVLLADDAWHPVNGFVVRISIQSDEMVLGSSYRNRDDPSNAVSWYVSGDLVRMHKLIQVPSGEGFNQIAYYTNRVLTSASGSLGTSGSTTSATASSGSSTGSTTRPPATTAPTTTNTTTGTTTGAATATRRCADAFVIGLAALLIVVTGTLIDVVG